MSMYYGYDKEEVLLAMKYDLSQEGSILRCANAIGEYLNEKDGTIFRTQLADGKLTDIEVDAMTEEELVLFNGTDMKHALIIKMKEKEVLVLTSDLEEELGEMIFDTYKTFYKLTSKPKIDALLTRYSEYKKHLSWLAQSAVK